uniref:Uncharacterized protein n=1 Tax=Craspedostauros australis TaxID=1486917 RepID=A0A7R9ZKP5_9STRA
MFQWSKEPSLTVASWGKPLEEIEAKCRTGIYSYSYSYLRCVTPSRNLPPLTVANMRFFGPSWPSDTGTWIVMRPFSSAIIAVVPVPVIVLASYMYSYSRASRFDSPLGMVGSVSLSIVVQLSPLLTSLRPTTYDQRPTTYESKYVSVPMLVRLSIHTNQHEKPPRARAHIHGRVKKHQRPHRH